MVIEADLKADLDLLYYAGAQTGNQRLIDIATTHAHTVLRAIVRDDWSTYHLIDFDPKTGTVKQQLTNQGYRDWSTWSRFVPSVLFQATPIDTLYLLTTLSTLEVRHGQYLALPRPTPGPTTPSSSLPPYPLLTTFSSASLLQQPPVYTSTPMCRCGTSMFPSRQPLLATPPRA